MKIVMNGAFGGYGLDVAEEFEAMVDSHADDRTCCELVEFVESYPDQCGDLAIVEIPDTATDWEIDDYDGLESVIYVVDGKIHHAH